MIGLYVRDSNGDISEELDDYTSAAVVLRFRDVSSWSIEVPPSSAATALAQPGASVVIERNDQVLISGPTQQVERTWSLDRDGLVISGLSDEVVLWDRLVYPATPAPPPFVFVDDAYDVFSGPAETVLRHYVQANCIAGPWARPVAGLIMTPDLGRGEQLTGRGRFQTVGEMLQELSLTNALGFEVRDLTFDVLSPVDRRDEIVFGEEVGNLKSLDYSFSAPSATHFVVAGGGEGTARSFLLGGDDAIADRWGRRIEAFRDRRDTEDVVELTQTLQSEIADQAGASELKLTPVDVPGMTFGTDYALGDTATALIDEVELIGTVSQVDLSFDAQGETVKPSLSTQTTAGARDAIRLFDTIRSLRRRTSALERTL